MNPQVDDTLVLGFGGYFQLRMATDPDPTDDPRGMSGYTFALPGEPDFDGILHFQPDEPGVCERDFGGDAFAPRVGVKVVSATLRGAPAPAFVGARITMPDARLVERNGIVVRNDFFALDPVEVRCEKDGVVLVARRDELDPARPGLPIVAADSPMLRRRQPKSWVSPSAEVAAATGLPAPVTDQVLIAIACTRSCLVALLGTTVDPLARAALEVRIHELEIVRRWWDLWQAGPRAADRPACLHARTSGYRLEHRPQRCGAGERDRRRCERPLADRFLARWLGRGRTFRIHPGDLDDTADLVSSRRRHESDMRAGDLIDGRFEIGELIATGGMGRVYVAVDRLEGRSVAVKVIRMSGDVAVERFGREVALMAELRHPASFATLPRQSIRAPISRWSGWRGRTSTPSCARTAAVGQQPPAIRHVGATADHLLPARAGADASRVRATARHRTGGKRDPAWFGRDRRARDWQACRVRARGTAPTRHRSP